MEIPYMILDEAKKIETHEQKKSCVVFTLKCHFWDLNDIFQITIIPIKTGTQIIKYKTTHFYCDNPTVYEKIIEYLVDQIKREIYTVVSHYQEINHYDPDDEDFDSYSINISNNDTTLFCEYFCNDNKNDVFETLKQHFKPYFYISSTRIHI